MKDPQIPILLTERQINLILAVFLASDSKEEQELAEYIQLEWLNRGWS